MNDHLPAFVHVRSGCWIKSQCVTTGQGWDDNIRVIQSEEERRSCLHRGRNEYPIGSVAQGVLVCCYVPELRLFIGNVLVQVMLSLLHITIPYYEATL